MFIFDQIFLSICEGVVFTLVMYTTEVKSVTREKLQIRRKH